MGCDSFASRGMEMLIGEAEGALATSSCHDVVVSIQELMVTGWV